MTVQDDLSGGGGLAKITPWLLATWFAATCVGAAYLLGAHVAGLPLPADRDPRLARAISARSAGRPMALHVLYVDCECSRRVLTRLEARAPRTDLDEHVVLVGEGAEVDAHASVLTGEGFALEQMHTDEVADALGLEVAPVLVLADAGGRVAYLGGYTERKQGAVVATDDLIDAVLHGERPTPLPVLGCAVTTAMRDATDPWRLR